MWAPGVGGVGSNKRLVGGAVYISSCRHTGIYNSLALSCAPIPHLYWKERGNPQLNPNTNMYKWLLRCALKGKLCCVDCTKTMAQCMSLYATNQGFPNSVEGWWKFLQQWGDEKFSWGDLIYVVVGCWGGVILTIWTFFKAKNNIL